MAKSFWTGNETRSGTSAVETLIGRQTEVLGDVRFSGGLHVDGRITGTVTSNADKGAHLSVSETGVITGDVRAPNIVLNGQVIGNVVAREHLTLGTRARITGNVYYKGIELAGGAVINGQLVHEGDEAIAAPRAFNDAIVQGNASEALVKQK